MDELLKKLLAKLKALKNVTDESSDAAFLFALETAVNGIFNYCHINELPPQLENVAVLTALDALNEVNLSLSAGDGAGGEVKSLTEGDFTISKTTSLEVIQGLSALRSSSMIRNYMRTLNIFRKLL